MRSRREFDRGTYGSLRRMLAVSFVGLLVGIPVVSHSNLTGHPSELVTSAPTGCFGAAKCATGALASVQGAVALRSLARNVVPSVGSGGWTQLTALSSSPSGRTQPAIAYDPTLGEVALFGGYDASVNADGDTWLFVNNTWTDITGSLTQSPAARWGATMVWDPVMNALVLFGGRDVTGYYNDTWRFNGTNWTQISTATAPSARSLFQMAYDPIDRTVLLQGGLWRNLSNSSANWEYHSDIWTFQNGTWTNVSTLYTPSPGARALGQAAYDPWNRSVVLVGGLSANSAAGCAPSDPVETLVSNHTFTYPASTGPGPIGQEMMTYDPAGPYLFEFGGYSNLTAGCAQVNDTWVRTDGVWVNISASLPTAPSPRYLAGVTFDSADQEVLLFGGNSLGSYLGDTWTFIVPPLTTGIIANRSGGEAPLNVSLTAVTTGGSESNYSFNWSFGDGGGVSGSGAVAHRYASVGSYTVRLNVTDPANRSGYATLSVLVVAPLSCLPGASTVLGSVPITVSFSANPVGGKGPFTGRWTFGDGSGATGVNVTHSYTTSGNFTANVTLTDSLGDRTIGNVSLEFTPTLLTAVGGGPFKGVAPFEVSFNEQTSGGIPPYFYNWTFGDGASSRNASPLHDYVNPGTYTATVEVVDSVGRSASSNTTVIVLAPLSATAAASATRGVAPLPTTFTATVSGGQAPYSVNWTFGDGATGYGLVVSHTFSAPGNYTVTALAGDALGLQFEAQSHVLVVAPLSSQIVANATVTEGQFGIAFSAVSSGGLAPLNWTWSFGDGSTGYGAGPIDHRFPTPGYLVVRLTVRDALAEVSQSSRAVTVRPPLSATLAVSPSVTWVGNATNITASVTGGEAPYSYDWSGLPTGCVASNTTQLVCRPSAAGAFNVSLVVRDALNRSITRWIVMGVIVPPPASFPATPNSTWELAFGLVAAAAIGLLALGLAVRSRRRRSLRGSGTVAEDGGPATPATEEWSSQGGTTMEPPSSDEAAPDGTRR